MAMMRAATLLACLASCSDDGDDKTGLDGGRDGGTDAGDAALDACVPVPLADAGSELADALRLDHVDTTLRRAQLIAPAYCEVAVRCMADAGTAEGCVAETIAAYEDVLTRQVSEACLDAELDLSACIGTRDACALDQCAAANTRCATVLDKRDALCAPDAGTPP